jgi:hypothetical protein
VPGLAFVKWHDQALVHAGRDSLGVVRVHDQRIGQLLGRAGEAGQDEHARVRRVLGGDELLRDQIHTVAERRDNAKPGETVESRQSGAPDRAGNVADRRPVYLGITAVDVADGAVQLAAEASIVAQFLTGGGGDLEEGDVLAVLGVGAEKVIDRLNAVGEPLGIIQPVDADNQRAAIQALCEPIRGDAGCVPGGDGRETGDVDTDWRDHGLNVTAAMHETAVAVRLSAQKIDGALQECVAVAVGVKADDIARTQSVEQFLSARQGTKERRRHKRGVEEKSDALLHAEGAQFMANGEQLIVMHPDQVVRPKQRGKGRGECAVDGAIAGIIVLAKGNQAEPVQQQRVQRAIGETVVIATIIGLAEVDCGVGDATSLHDGRLRRGRGGAAPAPAEPERTRNYGVCESDGKASGGGIAVTRHRDPI